MKFEPVDFETQQLRIRLLSPSDAIDLYSIYSDPETMRYLSKPPYAELSQAEAKIQQALKAFDEGVSLSLAVISKENRHVVGELSLFHIHDQSMRAEIGYILLRDEWGKGLMSEAMHGFIKFCFTVLDLRRLEADIDPANVASRSLLLKLGFEKEGLLKERWLVNSKITDSEVYGLLRSDYL